MKKFVSILLAAVMVLCVTGCSLFSKGDSVKLGSYEHKDPSGVTYDTRTVLKNTRFGADLANYASTDAYPDTMMYNENGEVIGLYDYDPATGLAKGWSDLSGGTYTAFEPGQEVDLGMPDESKIVTFAGDVALYFVVYVKGNEPVESDAYLLLSSSADKDAVLTHVFDIFGLKFTAESDTVLKMVSDKAAMSAEMASVGMTDAVTGESYIEYLKSIFSAREDVGVNPYKPYAGHKDPADIEYDQKVVLTGSGQAAVTEDLTDCVASQTDYLYGKDGNMVAAYMYLEGTDKASTDKLAEMYNTAERVSDTVILIAYTGDAMTAVLDAYMGYNVIKDHSVAEYTRMIEETFYSVVYEG